VEKGGGGANSKLLPESLLGYPSFS